jgi:hypothetical protein
VLEALEVDGEEEAEEREGSAHDEWEEDGEEEEEEGGRVLVPGRPGQHPAASACSTTAGSRQLAG